jgi:hypothetical protein
MGKRKDDKKKKDRKSTDNGESGIAATGSREAFDRFSREVSHLDRRELLRMKGDPRVAFSAVERGLSQVMAQSATVVAELPAVRLDELVELLELSRALVFAADQVQTREGADKEIETASKRLKAVRKHLVRSAESAVKAGALDADAVGTAKGKGRDRGADLAKACRSLATLLGSHTPEGKRKARDLTRRIEQANEAAGLLDEAISRGGSVEEAEEMRDRLWTLLNERWDRVWRVGAYLFGQRVHERVPALQSRASTRGLAKA